MAEKRWEAFESRRKSKRVAYLLWLLLGALGMHRFYLGMKPSGIGMACLTCASGATLFVLWDVPDEALLAATVTVLPLLVWVLPDAFRIPGLVRTHNDLLIRRLNGDITRRRPRGGHVWLPRRQ
ncbi:MAG: NINE protein [Candidatus Tectomicrobia bacterium]|nr:NINE protein [Rhodospirillaceae bacterium]MDE0207476.1 NINE protein [Candidatus Tectomicrobia bacterium]